MQYVHNVSLKRRKHPIRKEAVQSFLEISTKIDACKVLQLEQTTISKLRLQKMFDLSDIFLKFETMGTHAIYLRFMAFGQKKDEKNGVSS